MALAELSFDGKKADFGWSVRHFDVSEGLSTPFEVALVVTSPHPDVDFDELVGQRARFRLERGPLGARTFTGVCSFVEQQAAEPGSLTSYAIHLVPSLWLLGQRRGHRLFQHVSTPEIVQALLAEWGIEASLRLAEGAYPKHEVRVQYGESDLAFVSRLLEDAGISYFFEECAPEDGPRESRLVLCDHPERGEARAGGPVSFASHPSPSTAGAFVTDLRLGHRVRPRAVAIGDFDFRRPRFQPTHRAERPGEGEALLEHHVYAPGASLMVHAHSPAHSNETPLADGLGRTRSEQHHGDARAEAALAGLRQRRHEVQYSTNLVDLSPGVVFSVGAAPRQELSGDEKLVVTGTSIEGSVIGDWQVSGTAALASAPVRPVRTTPAPRIEGVQSAIVVGPPGEEIHCDEFGRVRVRFPWDREGEGDPHRSPWVRVDEGAGGKGWGSLAMPRVGQEVLVAFYEGNPDQPVIVGRVYDASNPSPYALPEGLEKSVWRSRSSPESSGHHEISFDDRQGHELIRIRSERDLEKVVKREEVETTGADRTATIGRNHGATIGGDDVTEAGRMHLVELGHVGPAPAGEDAAPELTPSGTRREIVAKRITLTTGGATILLDGPDIVVTADKGLRIQAGGTVSIQGAPYVHLNPPVVNKPGESEMPKEAPDHLVWFKLLSKGQPLPGARVHVEHEDGTTSEPQMTDGNGLVHLPVEKAGSYRIRLGTPKQAEHGKDAPASPTLAAGQAAPVIDVGKTPAQKTQKAKPTEHEVPVELEILEPKPQALFEIEPGDATKSDPAMPTIPLHARVLVKGEPVSLGVVRWELHVSGKYRVRAESGYRQQEYRYVAGHAASKPDEKKKYEPAPPQLTGGHLTVVATFEGGAELGGITATRKIDTCRVAGKNPPRSEVEALIIDMAGPLAWLYLRMFCVESNHQLTQFARGSGGGNTPQDPLYGPPSGVGIVQRDPTADEWRWPASRLTTTNNFFPRIFWDWKKNVAEGIRSFENTYIARGRYDLEHLRKAHPHLPEWSEGVLMRAAIRRYNGGSEYGASADGRHYVVAPSTSNTGYVDAVLGDPHVDAHAHPVPADVRATIWPAR